MVFEITDNVIGNVKGRVIISIEMAAASIGTIRRSN